MSQYLKCSGSRIIIRRLVAMAVSIVVIWQFVCLYGCSNKSVFPKLVQHSLSNTAKLQHLEIGMPPKDATTTQVRETEATSEPKRDVDTCSFSARKNHLLKVCHSLGLNSSTPRRCLENKLAYNHFIADDKHKVLYCYVPKVGTTSWKQVVALQSGKMSKETIHKHPMIVHTKWNNHSVVSLSEYDFKGIRGRLNSGDYTKFVIVRNPFSRLYSAYKDKFIESPKYSNHIFGKLIRELYPDLPTVKGFTYLPFEHFIEMLVKAQTSKNPLLIEVRQNEHFRPIYDLCYPCTFDYDIISKLETMDDDKTPLLKLYNATELPRANSVTGENIFNHTAPSSEEAFSKVPAEAMEKLLALYHMDFELFGYSKSIVNGPQCDTSEGQKYCC